MSFAMKNLTAGQLNAIVKNLGGEEAAIRFASGQGRVVFDSLVADEAYWRDAGVAYLSPNFRAQFVNREIPETDMELGHDRLGQNMTGQEVVAHLGGEEQAETPIHAVREFMSRNRRSDEWFIVVARGKDGNLWAVDAFWHADYGGWFVHARPVTDLDQWLAGRRLLSRK